MLRGCLSWCGVILLLFHWGGVAALATDTSPSVLSPPSVAPCARIVSLAPSVTEVIFELGLGDALVGVSRYDRFPTQVQSLPRVGGLFDPYIEAIVALRPSLVVALVEFGDRIDYVRSLGLEVQVIDHRSVQGILESLRTLGQRCGVARRADELEAHLKKRIEVVRSRVGAAPPVRTLVVVGGGSNGASLTSVFVSGRDGFYDEILALAGGENVVTGNTVSVPTVSAEGLLALDPEVIIQVRNEEESRGVSAEALRRAWDNLSLLRAVKHRRVYVLSDDYMTVPGPRFVEALERFAEILSNAQPGGETHG